MALTASQLAITKLYVGAFGRAPEKSGLEYWDAQMAGGRSFNDIVDTVFSLPVVKAIYPDAMTNDAFITAIYTNVFGRQPDAEGLAYWQGRLANGQPRGRVVLTMIEAGLGTPDGTPGKAWITNRVSAADLAADLQLTRNYEVDEHRLIELISSVDDIAANYQAALAAINAAVPVTVNANNTATVTATANTDLFKFAAADAANFRVINGLAVGDWINIAAADGTNGDYVAAPVASAAEVNLKGEWFFNNATDQLTYFNELANASAQVQLTGVNTMTVDQNAVFVVTGLG